ncbi:MAG: phospholipase D-like domain-containing protein [Candidatus Desantisbacteria bacterium]
MTTKLLAILLTLLSCTCHAAVSSYPADIIILPNDGQKPILELIQNAVESVWICSYNLSDKKIINSLCTAKQCGVDVRVMLEGKQYGNSTVNIESAKKLIRAGITFSWSNPQFILTHANYIIVDHCKILLMTLDLTESIIHDRGYGVFISDQEIIREAEAVFIADWQKKEHIPAYSGILLCPDNSTQGIIELISNTKKKLWIQAHLLQDEEIIKSIIEAKNRGVSLRIILAETTPLSNDINLETQKYLSQYGISIKLQSIPSLHNTMMLFDEKIAFVGSQGLDAQSLNDNREMGIVIIYPQAIKRLKWIFSYDWKEGR